MIDLPQTTCRSFQYQVATLLLCFALSVQQVHAVSKSTFMLGTGTAVTVFGLYSLISFINTPEVSDGGIGSSSRDGSFSAEKNHLKLFPVVQYQVDKLHQVKTGAQEMALRPKVYRGQFLKSKAGEDATAFLQRAVCGPLKKVIDPSVYSDIQTVHKYCERWFVLHDVKFPHQALKMEINQFNTTVIPFITYDFNKPETLKLRVMDVSFRKPRTMSPISSLPASEKTYVENYLIPKIKGFDVLSENEKYTVHNCRYYPVGLPPMQELELDNKGEPYFDFPTPGLSNLHSSNREFFIATFKNDKQQTQGYYWQIKGVWPDGFQELTFNIPLLPRSVTKSPQSAL